MRLNTAYLAWGLRRLRAGPGADILAAAIERRVLCPAETATLPPAIYPEGALEAIRGLSPWRDRESEMRLVLGGTGQHDATEAHVLKDVRIAGAFVYKGAARSRRGTGAERPILTGGGAVRDLDAAHLVSNWTGAQFFGALLLDDFPLGLAPPGHASRIVMAGGDYAHEAGYRALLGLTRPPEIGRARVRRLTLYTDYAQNSFKAARYAELRRRLRAALPQGSPPAGVYIKRGATGERRILANEAEIEARLAAAGFDIVEPRILSAAEIVRRTLDAPVVVGVEGSHLSHAIYTVAAGGAFFVLQPPDRFAMAYKEFTDRMEMRFAFLVGEPAEGGFRIDPGAIEDMLGRLA